MNTISKPPLTVARVLAHRNGAKKLEAQARRGTRAPKQALCAPTARWAIHPARKGVLSVIPRYQESFPPGGGRGRRHGRARSGVMQVLRRDHAVRPRTAEHELRRREGAHGNWATQRRPVMLAVGGGGSRPAGVSFTVGQFNILAASASNPRHFPYVRPRHLSWRKRRQVLLRQIRALDADVLCLQVCCAVPCRAAPRREICALAHTTIFCALQELDNYWTFFRQRLADDGYDSVYLPRPSHTPAWSKRDGNGIFYKVADWMLAGHEQVYYTDENDRVALGTLLRHRRRRDTFLLAVTTHLYWDARGAGAVVQDREVRELETAVLRWLESFRKQPKAVPDDDADVPADGRARDPAQQGVPGQRAYQAVMANDGVRSKGFQPGTRIGVVITGDFNAVPGSPPIEFMLNDFGERLGVQLKSAYSAYPGGPAGDAPYTSWNFRRAHTLDYIFHDSALRTTQLARLPSVTELEEDDGPEGWRDAAVLPRGACEADRPSLRPGIPNARHGSDHIPILARLEYVDEDDAATA